MRLDPRIRRLATGQNFAAFTTLMPDGQPQTHIMWIDADEEHLLINTEIHRAKFLNVMRDPRVTVTIWDRDDPYRFAEVRGKVITHETGALARAHIDTCAQRYFGRDYPADQIASERVLLRILPERVHFNGIGADGDA